MEALAVSSQIGFKNVLYCTDFSRTADMALPYAIEIARRFSSTIHAVHVVRPSDSSLVPSSEWHSMVSDEDEFLDENRSKLSLELQGLPHDFVFPSGGVWPSLASIIEDRSIDLIVLGTHGRTGIRKVLAGSVAEEVFRQAGCPVLSVGPNVNSKGTQDGVADLIRILYATDFGPESLAAAPSAIALAKEYRAELMLMHAIESVKPGELNSAFQTLREVIPLGAGLLMKPRFVVRQGAPSATILGVAARHDSDLIILGVRSVPMHSAASTHFSQSITNRVISEARCPVLTIRR